MPHHLGRPVRLTFELLQELQDVADFLNEGEREAWETYEERCDWTRLGLDLERLPTFGGDPPHPSVGARSWDRDRVLVQDEAPGPAPWKILPRHEATHPRP